VRLQTLGCEAFVEYVRWYCALPCQYVFAPSALNMDALRCAFAVPTVVDAMTSMASFHAHAQVRLCPSAPLHVCCS
jgi:hypothetical protein